MRDQLAAVVKTALARGGVMLMAAFAVGRAEQLIYLLQVLMAEERIPAFPIYLDSPMAVSGRNIYRYYAGEHDLSEGLAIDKQTTRSTCGTCSWPARSRNRSRSTPFTGRR